MTLNFNSIFSDRPQADTSDANRHAIAPTPGDRIVLDDGREGTVIEVKWFAEGGKLTTARVTTSSFVCSLGEVAFMDKIASTINEFAEA